MTVLEGRDVTKVFREGSQTVAVLNGASLSLDRGEIVALEGVKLDGLRTRTRLLCVGGCMNKKRKGADP